MARIRSNLAPLIGDIDDPQLGPLTVDIMSSNTHSVVNLLSPYLHSHRDEILEWGKEHCKEVPDCHPPARLIRINGRPQRHRSALRWIVCTQLPLLISTHFLKRRPSAWRRIVDMVCNCCKLGLSFMTGILQLVEQEFTGITVQVRNRSL